MMKKLKLDLDDLTVESFRTADGGSPGAGTVRGHYDELEEFGQQIRIDSVVAAYGCGTDTGTSDFYTPVGCVDTTTSDFYTPVGCTGYTGCQESCGGTCYTCDLIACVV